MTVLLPNEVELYGTRFPIIGPIQRILLDPFPAKVAQGDYTRDDELVASSWVQSDWSGGLGIEHGVVGETDNRYYYGTLETRFPHQLSLPPLVEKLGDLGIVDFFIDFHPYMYAFVGTEVYRWNEPTREFTHVHTLGSQVRDVEVYHGTLYVATLTSPIEWFDGTTWGTEDIDAHHLAVWNDTLYALQYDGTLRIRDEEGWVTGPKLDLPEGWATQLLTFFDPNENPALFALTKSGLWAYDTVGAQGWVETQFTFPVHPNVGRATVWQGSLYVPVGATVYRFTGDAVQVVGPDRDEGLPPHLRGWVTQVAAAHGHYFATISASESEEVDRDFIYTAYPSSDTFFLRTPARSALLVSNGSSWMILFNFPGEDDPTGALHVSNVQGAYRLWMSSRSGTYSMELPTTMHNPLKNPTARFAAEGSLVTSWFNARWPELTKLALNVKAVARHASPTESVAIYAQVDEDMEWRFVGRVERTGQVEFPLYVHSGGIPFRRIRFRLDFQRGSDDTKTPVLDSISLTFVRRPKIHWATQFVVDLTKPHRGLSVSQLRQRLEEILASPTAGTLYYYPDPDADEPERIYVLPSRAVNQQIAGTDQRGRFPMSVIQIAAQ